MQFALRVNKIKELNNHFNNVNSQYTKLSENVSYTTLSESEFDVRMPLFFIKYNIRNFNDSFNHENKAVGINSIWLGSTELKQDILELVDYGFELIDILIIEPLNKKAFLMVNNNFNVKIFENDKDVIEGLSIKTNDINYIKERLVNAEIPFEEKVTLKKRQLILNPEVTNSLFFEFIE